MRGPGPKWATIVTADSLFVEALFGCLLVVLADDTERDSAVNSKQILSAAPRPQIGRSEKDLQSGRKAPFRCRSLAGPAGGCHASHSMRVQGAAQT